MPEKQWGSIRETHFQAEEILIVKAQRSAFSEPLAVIRITAARSPFGMTTPPRKATTLPELAGTRSPGTTMPTRFIGSAAETGIVSPDGCSWRMAHKDSTATGNANCSPKKAADEPAAPNLPAVFKPPQDHQQFAPFRKDRFAGKKFAEDDPDLANGFERAVLAEKARTADDPEAA